jgi:hypothetical protein
VRPWGEDTPSEPKPSREDDEEEDEDVEEGEVTPPPHSPPYEALPLLSDLFHRKAGIAVSVRQEKRTQIETVTSTGSPS